tara:strand:+ start:3713 stop:4429 length:717 start_codon:yes stop_codon:yes gene_type:complete
MKKIILTGCSKGIGKSITKNLLNNEYFVIGISRNSNNFIEQVKNDNKNFEHIEADLLDDKNLDKVLEVFDKDNLYGLINNAGVGLDGILATLPITDIDKLISLNLRVPILLARAMSRNIVKNKTAGRIINISSIISQNGYNGLSVYSATKSGLNGLTLSLARELGRTGTTVNAILPGYIKTDMTNKLSDKQLDQIVRRTPLGKLTTTDDIANIIEYLLSKKGKSVTGQLIKVDNGITV